MASGGMDDVSHIRIEHEAGGAARLAMSECDSDAIDKEPDARAKHERGVSAGEAVNRLCRELRTIGGSSNEPEKEERGTRMK